jgi:hypothetical protein
MDNSQAEDIINDVSITSLDADSLMQIFGYLSTNPFQLLLVDKRWLSLLATNQSYWRTLAYQRWPSLNILPPLFLLKLEENDSVEFLAIYNDNNEREIKRRRISRTNDVDNNYWKDLFYKRHLKSLGYAPMILKASKQYATLPDPDNLQQLLQLTEKVKQASELQCFFVPRNLTAIEEQFIVDSVLYSDIQITEIATHGGLEQVNFVKGTLMNLKGAILPFYFKYNAFIDGRHTDGNTEEGDNEIRIGNINLALNDIYDRVEEYDLWLERVRKSLLWHDASIDSVKSLIRKIMIPNQSVQNMDISHLYPIDYQIYQLML